MHSGFLGRGVGPVALFVRRLWVQRGGVLTASDAEAGDYFGVSVALSADGAVLAVGAHYWDGAAGADQGGVYLYDR